ncbi:MAG TPA: poly(3-hydroxybutyrate) depolymerase, partial [Casimicrobiaceae bacterium]|nr:poly(3-hydroxybutyrate) depolymerase [Casimicrobiaceae bacterium]
ATFFQTYGNVFSLYVADKRAAEARAEPLAEGRELPFVAEALASMSEGGFAEALARVACLLARQGEPLLLSRLQQKHALITEYRHLLPDVSWDEWRRVRGEQEIIVRYEPGKALATLPNLLKDPADRERLVTLARALLGDERVRRFQSAEQLATVREIGAVLDVTPGERAPARSRKAPAKRRRARAAKA